MCAIDNAISVSETWRITCPTQYLKLWFFLICSPSRRLRAAYFLPVWAFNVSERSPVFKAKKAQRWYAEPDIPRRLECRHPAVCASQWFSLSALPGHRWLQFSFPRCSAAAEWRGCFFPVAVRSYLFTSLSARPRWLDFWFAAPPPPKNVLQYARKGSEKMDKNKIRHELGCSVCASAYDRRSLQKILFPNKINKNMKQELTLHTRCLNGTASV